MLYAFCVNAGGHLEHLYWGEDIGESESLSYLQSSNVKIAFQTEAPPIDPSRQKKEFIQQFIEREKNKDMRVTCITDPQVQKYIKVHKHVSAERAYEPRQQT